MDERPSYDDLERRIQELEQESSAHQQTAADLLASEERFKALSNASFGGIVIHDNGLILDCNQSLSDMTGFTMAELVGMNGLDLIAPDSLDLVLKNISSGYEQRYEVEGLRKDGSVYPIAIKGKNIPYRGIEARVIEFLDITDRKRAQEEKSRLESRLQQAQKMEAIGTLAGGIAHDFNNILAVILGYAEMAKEDSAPGTPLNNDVDQILIAADRAKGLVRQILDFGRKSQTVLTPMRLQPLIKEALKMLRSSIPSTISITTDIQPDCATVLADPTQVHQILINLCTNAYQAMEQTGGVLAVTLKNTQVSPTEAARDTQLAPGHFVELVVSDTGDGVDKQIIDKIFEPYFTTKRVGRGTGMGLSIIHGIMEQYGGAVTVKSDPGMGSTFQVYFPVAQAEAPRVPADSREVPRGTERILLVDDEELLCEMGQDILERLGYRVTKMCNSLEALELFRNERDQFDLVITDQTMPDLTGAELSHQLLKIRPEIPIILCTGYSNQVDEQSAKAIGIKEFTNKPFTNRVLGTLVRKVLDSR
ncbi:MAG: response regulator [Candidatus Krumholzibacteria bacterium]|nr:response regulator [Candidatus Krumholzibacteria bacterium]